MNHRPLRALLLGLAVAACETDSPSGTPSPPATTVVEDRKFVVFFDLGSTRIPESQLIAIRDAAAAARVGSGRTMDVTGYTDRAGSDRANDRLSLRRAEAVRAELRRAGAPATAITVKGAGESRPFMPTEDGVRAPENRRVEIVVR